MPRRPTRRAAGFTLIEMLIAVTVLALLGIMSWRGLDHLIAQRARLDADVADMESVVRSLGQFERDIQQRITDAQHEGHIGVAPGLPLAVTMTLDTGGIPRFRVLRARPAQRGAQLVTWYLSGRTLVRETALPNTTAVPERLVVLENVDRIGARVLVRSGWTEAKAFLELGLGGGPAGALELSIDRPGGERYVKVVPL